MFDFEKDIINPKAKYHVFIGTDKHRSTKEAFQVCKYSLHSLVSEDISIISIPYIDFLHIPLICKENKLKGKALYINETFLFKDDVIKLFKETDKEEALVWATKFKDRVMWSSLLIFNLNSTKLLSLLPTRERIDKWSATHKYNFKWIASRDLVIDFEVRPLPFDWNIIPNVTDKEAPKYTVKAINFDGKGPWNTINCKYSIDWFKEYKLFLENEIFQKLLTTCRV